MRIIIFMLLVSSNAFAMEAEEGFEIRYKNFVGKAEFFPKQNKFSGTVQDINWPFEGETREAAAADFFSVVDDALAQRQQYASLYESLDYDAGSGNDEDSEGTNAFIADLENLFLGECDLKEKGTDEGSSDAWDITPVNGDEEG